jgi:hypothetical protein
MTQAPPIVKLSEQVLVAIEEAVLRFPRSHKYTIGSDLRREAATVARHAHRAWRDASRRGDWISKLVWAVDDLKLSVQIAQQLRVFRSFAQFEAIARTVSDLGRQCGGWQKQHQKGQNDQSRSTDRRAQILSSRGTSGEVNQ